MSNRTHTLAFFPGSNLVLVVALVAGGCTGTDVGNPRVDIDVSLYDSTTSQVASEAGASAAVSPGARAVPAGFTIDQAWVAIDRIRLRDAADCDGSSEIELEGPFAIDMLAPDALAALRDVEVPALGYCRFELRWSPFDEPVPGGVPAEIADASLLLLGERGDGTPVILRSERNDELRLDARDGSFTIDETTPGLVVGLDAAVVLDGLDIDGAVVSGDGTIRIESGSNDDLLSRFDRNLADAVKLFDDDDGDGLLGRGEFDEDDILAD